MAIKEGYNAGSKQHFENKILKRKDGKKTEKKKKEVDPKEAKRLNCFLLICRKKYGEALKCLDEKLKIFPESVYLLHQKGHAPYKIEKHEEALKYSDKISEANLQYIPALYTKISCLEEIMKNKDIYEKSIRHRLW